MEGPEPWLPLTHTYFRKQIKICVNSIWDQRWVNTPFCRQTKLWLPHPTMKIAYNLLNNSKKHYGTIVRWITGHNFLNRHRHIINPQQQPTAECRHCNSREETSWHIAAECGKFNSLRFKHFNQYQLNSPPLWTGPDLANFLKDKNIELMEQDQDLDISQE